MRLATHRRPRIFANLRGTALYLSPISINLITAYDATPCPPRRTPFHKASHAFNLSAPDRAALVPCGTGRDNHASYVVLIEPANAIRFAANWAGAGTGRQDHMKGDANMKAYEIKNVSGTG